MARGTEAGWQRGLEGLTVLQVGGERLKAND